MLGGVVSRREARLVFWLVVLALVGLIFTLFAGTGHVARGLPARVPQGRLSWPDAGRTARCHMSMGLRVKIAKGKLREYEGRLKQLEDPASPFARRRPTP